MHDRRLPLLNHSTRATHVYPFETSYIILFCLRWSWISCVSCVCTCVEWVLYKCVYVWEYMGVHVRCYAPKNELHSKWSLGVRNIRIYIYIIPTYFEYFAHSEKKKKETCLYAARHTLVSYSPCNTYDIIFRKSVLSSRAPSPFFLPFLSFFLCLSVSLSPFLFLSSIILFSSSARSWLRPFSRSVIIH